MDWSKCFEINFFVATLEEEPDGETKFLSCFIKEEVKEDEEEEAVADTDSEPLTCRKEDDPLSR
jgi:hypothetical protein